MFRALMVPVDGSMFAEHALPTALSIARRREPSSRLYACMNPRFLSRSLQSAWNCWSK